jgi:deoxyribodipyrimidine photo-lyase
VIDTSYEALDEMARKPLADISLAMDLNPSVDVPPLDALPPSQLNIENPHSSLAEGRKVWLVHPWSLGDLPADLPKDTLVIGIFVSEFHRAWPWNEKRWLFVQSRMAELASDCWYGDRLSIELALQGAKRLGGMSEAHIGPWLPTAGKFISSPTLFSNVERRCDSFSKWWRLVSQ